MSEDQRSLNIAEFRKQNFIAHMMAADVSDRTMREKHEAAEGAWKKRTEIANLEMAVVEAAVAWFESLAVGRITLRKAELAREVRRLIVAREKKEQHHEP